LDWINVTRGGVGTSGPPLWTRKRNFGISQRLDAWLSSVQ